MVNNVGPTYLPSSSDLCLHQQIELNDLVPDISQWKQQAELLCSRLQWWDLLAKRIIITSLRKINSNFSEFCKLESSIYLKYYRIIYMKPRQHDLQCRVWWGGGKGGKHPRRHLSAERSPLASGDLFLT